MHNPTLPNPAILPTGYLDVSLPLNQGQDADLVGAYGDSASRLPDAGGAVAPTAGFPFVQRSGWRRAGVSSWFTYRTPTA